MTKRPHRILWLHKPVTEMLSNMGIESGESKSVIPSSLRNAHMMNGLLQTGSEPLESTYEMKQMNDDKLQLDAANIMDELVSMMQNTASASGKLVSNMNTGVTGGITGSPGTHNEIYKNAINQSLEELQMADPVPGPYQGAYNQLYDEIDVNKNEYLKPSIKELEMAQSTKLTPNKIHNITLPEQRLMEFTHAPNSPQQHSSHGPDVKKLPDHAMMIRPMDKVQVRQGNNGHGKGNKVVDHYESKIHDGYHMNTDIKNDKNKPYHGDKMDKHRDQHYEDEEKHYEDKDEYHKDKGKHFGNKMMHHVDKQEHNRDDRGGHYAGHEEHYENKGQHYRYKEEYHGYNHGDKGVDKKKDERNYAGKNLKKLKTR
jgi:hypothetical protein